MVAKIISGKTIRGALNYNEHKVEKGKAELIFAANFLKDAAELTYKEKIDRFLCLIRQNERTRTNAVHISLNFDKQDNLSQERLQQIAESYMEKIGFGEQPFLVYEHYDAAHKHIHIVATNISEGGNRISLHEIGKNQSEQARKEIEKEFGLIQAESKRPTEDIYLKPIILEKVLYGKTETKAAVSNIVREVVKTYRYTSLAELNAVLRQFNVVADPGEPGTLKYDKKGLTYSVLDSDGNKIGVPIKASAIYGRPILGNLEKRFANNAGLRDGLKTRLKRVLDTALNNPNVRTGRDLADILLKDNIQVIWRENKDGRLYGVTYVDNGTRAVFNGSDLGKAYSANALTSRLSRERSKDDRTITINAKASIDHIDTIKGDQMPGIIRQLSEADESQSSMDYHFKQEKKKKKRKGRKL